MKTLKTMRLKPNPAGKDRTRAGGATRTQLGGEWADIVNTGIRGVDMTGVRLRHVAYSADGKSTHWEDVLVFSKGTLDPGQSIRVHSGSGPESVLREEDRQGATYHVFRGSGRYVWNNHKGDCATLWEAGAGTHFDRACYDAFPPEGAVLNRRGDKLVPAAAAVARR